MADLKPAGEVLVGLELRELPDGYVPLEAAMIVKALDADGDVVFLSRWTANLHQVEAIGFFTGALDLARHDLIAMYQPDGDDD